MDRRVLFVSLILFAGGATGVGVAVFAFVGIDDTSIDMSVAWETEPVEGDDGSGAVIATMDGDPIVVQSVIEDGERAVRATAVGSGVLWTTPLSALDGDVGDHTGDDPPAISPLTAGTLGGDDGIAFTTADGTLVVLDTRDGSERLSVDADVAGGIQPAIGQLGANGSNVVTAAGSDGTVVAVDDTGETVFETSFDGDIDRRPLLVAADADADTTGGIAVLTEQNGTQTAHLFDATGAEQWSTTPSVTPLSWTTAETRSGPILAFGGANGNLETIEADDGSLRYEVGLQDLPVVVGDAGPGQIHVGGSGSVWAVDLLDGEVAWKQQYGGQSRVNSPGVGDVAGDGTLAPVAVNRDGGVLSMSRTGEVVARDTVGTAIVYAGPLFADVTDDDSDEVIIVTEDGRIIALTHDSA